LLSRKPGKLVAELPAEEFGEECGLGPRIELGRMRCMLPGTEPDKELSSLLAT